LGRPALLIVICIVGLLVLGLLALRRGLVPFFAP
jgi:hypothetical protein